MKKLFFKHKFLIVGSLLGAIGGYSYYYFIGCVSGTCAITSNPIISTLYGGFMGALLISSFDSKKEVESVTKKEI